MMEEVMGKAFGRRNFLKGLAVAGAGMMGAGALAACAPQASAEEGEYDFAQTVAWDGQYDVVVVGAKVTAENLATGEVLAVETDEFGDFWFRQVGKAAWRVYVEAEGYLTRVLEASTAEEDRNMGPVALYKAE